MLLLFITAAPDVCVVYSSAGSMSIPVNPSNTADNCECLAAYCYAHSRDLRTLEHEILTDALNSLRTQPFFLSFIEHIPAASNPNHYYCSTISSKGTDTVKRKNGKSVSL